MRSSFLLRALWIGFLFLAPGCSSLFYAPTRAKYADPTRLNQTYRELKFKSQDGTSLTGWLISRAQLKAPSRGLVVQFHGNGENMSSHFVSLSWLTEFGFDVMVFDYRGYGASAGVPDQTGVVEDAVAAIHFAYGQPEAKAGIILYGQSLGGVVLLKAFESFAHREAVRLMVIEASFLSYPRMAQNVLSRVWVTWPFQGLGRILISGKMNAEDSVSKLDGIPLLVIHGTADRVVPHDFGLEIYSKANEPKSLWLIPKANHMQPYFMGQGENRELLVQTIERLMREEKK